MEITVGQIVLWVVLAALGFSYGGMALDWWRLKKGEVVFSPEESEAPCFIFYGNSNSSHMRTLIGQCSTAYVEAGARIKRQSSEGNVVNIEYSEGSRVLIYNEKSALRPPKDIKLLDYDLKVFVDTQLPAPAALELLEGLGLRPYMINFGYIGEDYGSE